MIHATFPWLCAIFLVGACQRGDSKQAPSGSSTTGAEQAGDEESPPNARPVGCSLKQVQAVVQPNRGKITDCYRRSVYKDKTRAGRLVVEIVVDKTGSAKFLGVKEDEIGDHEMTRCIFKVLKPLPYPVPPQGSCTILYPFQFSAGPPAK